MEKPVLQNDWNQCLSLVHTQLQKIRLSCFEFTKFSVRITKSPDRTLIERNKNCIWALYRLYSICRLWHRRLQSDWEMQLSCTSQMLLWVGGYSNVCEQILRRVEKSGPRRLSNGHLQYVPWSKALKGKIHLQMYSVLLTLLRTSLSCWWIKRMVSSNDG